MKQYRITCDYLNLRSPCDLTMGQCVRLIRALKPEEIEMDSPGSNIFHAHFQTQEPVSSSFLREFK